MLKVYDSIKDISKEKWNDLNKNKNPFLFYEFFYALEESNVIGRDKGWLVKYLLTDKAGSFFFIKSHSYGEYIFDWRWAEAYQAHGLSYYPKITSMIPFTPVSCDHFLGEVDNDFIKEVIHFAQSFQSSSIHFLFLNKKFIPKLREDFLIRESFQYYFYNNDYSSFDNYLAEIKSKKRKQILKERNMPSNIKIRRISSHELNTEHAKRMFKFYQETIFDKGSIQYLNEQFFIQTFKKLSNNILYVEATKEDVPIAASLFFYSEDKLYGRYWGASEYVDNLHFELCYYQGIEFCIDKNIKVFEAGAQGEHKIKRGFKPTTVYSAHQMKNKSFHTAIENFIEQERVFNESIKKELGNSLPFKSDQEF